MWTRELDYELPHELIAQYPTKKREEANLLIVYRNSGKIEHKKFYNIIEYLDKGNVLVLNETKVIPARLIGKREKTGGRVEVFLLNKLNENEWYALISPHRAKKLCTKIYFDNNFYCEIKGIEKEKTIVKFYCDKDFNFLLNKYGKIPLPPYIKREPEEIDLEKYQTVYARVNGSVAAPTAGLHFTTEILNRLDKNGIKIAKIILHIGLASFKPIKCEKIENHNIDLEYYEIPKDAIDKIKNGKKIIAVGTSTVRALESLNEINSNNTISGWTNKFIYPGYKFKYIKGMITNFHLPKSTNLSLVCAFAGKDLIFKAYKEAINKKYRFYSYGDAMLII